MSDLPIKNQIKRFRFEHNEMTQRELATQVGVTRQTIVAIEKAKYSPTLELAFKIVEVFGVDIDDVFQYSPTRASTEKSSTKKRVQQSNT